jgi:hypothetical protein
MFTRSEQARFDAIVEDLYQTKLNKLSLDDGWALWNELDNLSVSDFLPLGSLIRDNKPLEAGELLIKLVTNQLREDARNEAEGEK